MDKSMFKVIVPESKLHRKFKMINLDPQFIGQKKILEEWGKIFYDRDGKFVNEFQTTFHSSFWELYLSTVFKYMGFPISNQFSRPDFIIDGNNKMYIEAVVSNIKHDGIKESEVEMSYFNDMFEPAFRKKSFVKIMNEAITRYSNSIHMKSKKYLYEYKDCNWIDESNPFVIALGSYDQIAYGKEFIFPMTALLYGVYYNAETGAFESRNDVLKPGGKSGIDIGLFLKEEFNHISAIIFSCTVTLGKLTSLALSYGFYRQYPNNVINVKYRPSEKPHYLCQIIEEDNPETLTDGLFVFHNPNATNKIGLTSFDFEDITQITYDLDEEAVKMYFEDYPLVARINYPTFGNEQTVYNIINSIQNNYNKSD